MKSKLAIKILYFLRNFFVVSLILQCHSAYSDLTLKSGGDVYLFPDEYTEHFEGFETDPKVNILFQEKEYRIISVQTGYLSFNEDLYHDGFANKMYLVNNKDKVLDYYEKPLGYLKASYQLGAFFIVTDDYVRGGSGGKDYSGFLNILKVKDGSFVSLFRENISYYSKFKNSEKYKRIGHFAIDINESQLLLNISSTKEKIRFDEIPAIKSYSNSGSDIELVDSLGLKGIKSTIAIKLPQGSGKQRTSKLVKSKM
jgi:hypothetical protein